MKKINFFLLFAFLWLFPYTNQAKESGEEPIRIISYNIWNGFEENSRKEAFIEWMRGQDPDIVALQELVGFTEKDLVDLGAAYGHPYVAIVKEGGYPVGLTSKKPIDVKVRQVEGFWHGMLHTKTYGLDILVIHLSPFDWAFRLKEAQAITSYIRQNQLESCLVMGDFNALSPFDADLMETRTDLKKQMAESENEQKEYQNSRGKLFDYSVVSQFLANGFFDPVQVYVPTDCRGSFPTSALSDLEWGDPRLEQQKQRIDYILVSPALAPRIKGATVHNGKEADRISDHYPVSIILQE